MSQQKPIENAYYHGRRTTSEEDAQRYKPKAVDGDVKEVETTAGKSKWNSAGTFETVDFSKLQIQENLNSAFIAFGPEISHPTITLSITSVTFTGYASTMFTRNKKGLAFEINVVLNWATEDGEASGEIKFEDVDFTSITDFDIKYSTQNKNEVYLAVLKNLRGKEKVMRKQFAAWVEMMLALDQ